MPAFDADEFERSSRADAEATWGPKARAKGNSNGAQGQAGPKFTLTWLDEIIVRDDPAYLVDGILPARGLAEIIGPPKGLKTFFLTHVFLHIASGLKYCGRDVLPGAVVYVTSEGVLGAERRLIAMRRRLGIEGKAVPFAIVTVMPDLGTATGDIDRLRVDVRGALAKVGGIPLRAIAFDTLRRATPGKSENKAEEMGAFIANCGKLETEFECLVCPVHHTPRADEKHGSGTNAVDGAADAIIGLTRTDNGTKPARAAVTILRMKDGEEGDSWSFRIESEEVGADRDGKPLRGGYVEIETLPGQAEAGRKPKVSQSQGTALRALHEAINEVGEPAPASNHIPRNVRTTSVERWRTYAYKAGISTSEQPRARQQAFERASSKLIDGRQVGHWNGTVWIIA